jgi:hypothetical protein
MIMKQSSWGIALLVLLIASCTSSSNYGRGGYGRYRSNRQIEMFGTVRDIDRGGQRIDIEFTDSNGTRLTESVYYDEQRTNFERGVRFDEVRRGDRILVRGHRNRGRFVADSVLRGER